MTPLALAVLGAIAFLRAAEVAFSTWRILAEKRAAKQASQSAVQPIAERVFPWMVVVHGGWWLAMAAETALAPAAYGAAGPAILWGAGIVWALSLALRVWMWASLGRLWNVRIVERIRQPIVTHGPYRFVRHPNYLAVILEVAAVPLLLGAPWTALAGSLANAAILVPRVRREEAYLFGVPGYREAFGGKRRLIPKVF